ncbi:hypothetical protein [Streptomyces jumonjinensis]|uniref:hypothetical protein n=1 Tax=Streptomyces jumonjinensis TaxID=1945 RepID=UPI003787667A
MVGAGDGGSRQLRGTDAGQGVLHDSFKKGEPWQFDALGRDVDQGADRQAGRRIDHERSQ